MVAHAGPDGGVEGTERAEHRPEEKRIEPNDRGWEEKNWLVQVEVIGFDYSNSVEELVQAKGRLYGPTGA